VEFILESDNINDYLKSDELFKSISDEKEKIKTAFEYVRDEIHHSGDINSDRVTKTASEALKYKEGICISKALLLAAILRYGGIPAGLCYQRLTKGDMPDTGYIIHGLNAVYLSNEKKWIRLDARGNKKNVNAQFSTNEEKIAYPVMIEHDEIDYPIIYTKPHSLVIKKMENRKSRTEDPWDLSELYYVRKMTINDYEQIYDIWIKSGNVLNEIDDSKTGLEKYLNRNPNTCFVAENSGKIIGSIMSGHDGRRGYIQHTSVLKSERKKGVGKALVNNAVEALRAEGITKVALVALASNKPGNLFWETMGFTNRKDLVYRDKMLIEFKAINYDFKF
jgi:ribosomal protein S18 acetylase RimI-like enzyme